LNKAPGNQVGYGEQLRHKRKNNYKNMKRLIIAMAVTAFTVGAYAGEACAAKDQAACADKAKVAATCPASKKDMAQCPAGGVAAKKDGQKNVARSPKDAANNKS
jgi:hypothetical protein